LGVHLREDKELMRLVKTAVIAVLSVSVLSACKTVNFVKKYEVVGEPSLSSSQAVIKCEVVGKEAFNDSFNSGVSAAEDRLSSMLTKNGSLARYYSMMRVAKREAEQSANREYANAYNRCLLKEGYVESVTKVVQ
jgi:hypothetical protein